MLRTYHFRGRHVSYGFGFINSDAKIYGNLLKDASLEGERRVHWQSENGDLRGFSAQRAPELPSTIPRSIDVVLIPLDPNYICGHLTTALYDGRIERYRLQRPLPQDLPTLFGSNRIGEKNIILIHLKFGEEQSRFLSGYLLSDENQ